MTPDTYYARNRERMLAASKARYQRIKGAISLAAKGARASDLAKRRHQKALASYGGFQKAAAHVKTVALREMVNAFKATTPCYDCHVLFPAICMDFDHVRGTKVRDISAMLASTSASKTRILAEIAKCELVCANCHRIRHEARRLGYTR